MRGKLSLVPTNRLDEIAAEIRITWVRVGRDIAGTQRLLNEARDLCRSRHENFDKWCRSGRLKIHKTQIYNLLRGQSSSHTASDRRAGSRVHPVNVLYDEIVDNKFDDDDDLLNIVMELKQKLPMESGFWTKKTGNLHYKETPVTTCEWYTPEYVFQGLGCRFDLDPSSPGAEIVPWIPADRCFTLADDGLAQPWEGFIWLNPPFGKDRLIHWVRKFIEHGNGVILAPERTSTQWYAELEIASDLMLHLDKKLPFIDQHGVSHHQFPIGSHLIAIGEKGRAALINAYHNGLGRLSTSFLIETK